MLPLNSLIFSLRALKKKKTFRDVVEKKKSDRMNNGKK